MPKEVHRHSFLKHPSSQTSSFSTLTRLQQQQTCETRRAKMEGGRERKRRKWDVAAPQGIPIAQATNRPGIGSGAGAPNSMAGFITAQGQQPAALVASQAPYQPPATQVTTAPQPLTADIVARAKQGAAAVLEKINQVRRQSYRIVLLESSYSSVLGDNLLGEA